MKLFKTVQVAIDVKYVKAAVPFDEDDNVEMPASFVLGQLLKFAIDLKDGRVVGWPDGSTGSVHIKAVDRGSYWLLNADGEEVASIQEDYVPNGCVPGEYGDYVEFDVQGDGRIAGWSEPVLEEDSWRLTQATMAKLGVREDDA